MSKPANPTLYARVKAEVVRDNPTHSAYRSGLIVQEYKRRGGKYEGPKPKAGLTRWFKEDWRNQRGEVGYKRKGDVYRPTKRVTDKTPATMQELSQAEIRAAMKTKAAKGRVAQFKK